MATQVKPARATVLAGFSVLKDANPEMYRTNSFRVTGLGVDAGASEISRQIASLRLSSKFGTPAAALGVFRLDPPADEEMLRSALHRLKEPVTRLGDELFWFWQRAHGEPDEALQYLAAGDAGKAQAIWESEDDHNPAALHNRAILAHLTALDLEYASRNRKLTAQEEAARDSAWQGALPLLKRLCGSEPFWRRVNARMAEFDDPQLTLQTAYAVREALPAALLAVNAQLALDAVEKGRPEDAKRHVHLIRSWGFDASTVRRSILRGLEPIRQRIATICEGAEAELKLAPQRGDVLFRRVIDRTSRLREALGLLLPAGDPVRDGAYDEVALQALSCQISYGNKTEDWKASICMLEEVLSLAASASARTRIEDNLKIVRSNREFGLCFFCKDLSSTESAAVEVKMFGNVQRTPTWNGSRITWNKLTVKVPRCARCELAHSRVTMWTGFGFLAGAFAGLASCAPMADGGNEGGGFMVFLILMFGFGLTALAIAKSKYYTPAAILGKGQHKSYSRIEQLRKEGWAFGDRPQN